MSVEEKRPDNTIEWHETWYIREVGDDLEDLLGKREAAAVEDKACKDAESLKDYVGGMIRQLEDLVTDLQAIQQFVATEIPATDDYYVTEDWEEKPEDERQRR